MNVEAQLVIVVADHFWQSQAVVVQKVLVAPIGLIAAIKKMIKSRARKDGLRILPTRSVIFPSLKEQ